MITYVIRRLLQSIAILFILSILFFACLHLVPGGLCGLGQPISLVNGQPPPPSFLTQPPNCAQSFQVDQPIVTQYFVWLDNYVHGNFGETSTGSSVLGLILQKLPATVLLALVSYLLQQLIALPLGIFAALRQHTIFDRAFTVMSYAALSTPAFVLGLILVYLVAVDWSLLPPSRVTDVTLPIFWTGSWFSALWHDPGLVAGDLARHLVLPAFVLMVTGIAIDSRFMRAAMLQVIRQDYIRTARAKGVRRRAIIFKHAFRNAIPPIITNVALYLPTLVGGLIVVETVFTWDGIGYMFGWAIHNGELQVLQALVILSAVMVLLANLLADLAYGWADPRIRYD